MRPYIKQSITRITIYTDIIIVGAHIVRPCRIITADITYCKIYSYKQKSLIPIKQDKTTLAYKPPISKDNYPRKP